MQNLKKLKGDASDRKFFRKKYNESNSIVILSKKKKFKNILVYDAISRVLNKNKILAPKLYQEYYKNNYIEVEDFGNETIFKTLKKSKNKKFLYFQNIIKLLNQLQLIKDKKIRTFKNNYYQIPEYKKEILIQEANLLYKIEKLDIQNSLLSDNLDLDYVEILIRERFLFGKKNEKIYIIENNEN